MLLKRKETLPAFDRENCVPVLRSSICTGEKVAGFKNVTDGRFTDVMLIRTDTDYHKFLRTYGVKPEEVKKEW